MAISQERKRKRQKERREGERRRGKEIEGRRREGRRGGEAAVETNDRWPAHGKVRMLVHDAVTQKPLLRWPNSYARQVRAGCWWVVPSLMGLTQYPYNMAADNQLTCFP